MATLETSVPINNGGDDKVLIETSGDIPNPGDLAVEIDGVVHKCRMAEVGEVGLEVDVPTRQYIDAPVRPGCRTLGTFCWPVATAPGRRYSWAVVSCPGDPVPWSNWVDGWDEGCDLVWSADDWTTSNPGPVATNGSATLFTRKYGYVETGYGRTAPFPADAYYRAARDIVVAFSARNHLLSVSSTDATATFQCRIREAIEGTWGEWTEWTEYTGPVSVSADSTSFEIGIRVDHREGVNGAGTTVSYRGYPEIPEYAVSGVTATDGEWKYDYLAANPVQNCPPPVAVAATSTENKGEMALRAYPPSCRIYYLKASDDYEPDPETIRTTGTPYAGPFPIRAGERYSVYATDGVQWFSPVYFIEVPPPLWGTRFGFWRLYQYASPPTIKVPVCLDVAKPTSTGWFAAPGASGSGTSMDDPGDLFDIIQTVYPISVKNNPQTINVMRGEYRAPSSTSTSLRVRAYTTIKGGFASDWSRDVSRNRTVFVSARSGIFTGGVLDGCWFDKGDMAGAYGPWVDSTVYTVNCHSDPLIIGPTTGSFQITSSYGGNGKISIPNVTVDGGGATDSNMPLYNLSLYADIEQLHLKNIRGFSITPAITTEAKHIVIENVSNGHGGSGLILNVFRTCKRIDIVNSFNGAINSNNKGDASCPGLLINLQDVSSDSSYLNTEITFTNSGKGGSYMEDGKAVYTRGGVKIEANNLSVHGISPFSRVAINVDGVSLQGADGIKDNTFNIFTCPNHGCEVVSNFRGNQSGWRLEPDGAAPYFSGDAANGNGGRGAPITDPNINRDFTQSGKSAPNPNYCGDYWQLAKVP